MKNNQIQPDLNSNQLILSLLKNTGDLSPRQTSNTMGLYDICPKYARQGSDPYVVSSADESTRVRNFRFKGKEYVVVVEAAKLLNEAGDYQYFFPSSNEELVEDVLRHLLTIDNQMAFFEDNLGCYFSVYYISQEFKKHGKKRSNSEIRHSLNILKKARLEIFLAATYDDGRGDPLFSGPFFNDATVIDFNRYCDRANLDEQDVKGRVKFHNMVSEALRELDFRLIRYDICMSYRSDMARYVHKRISHRFSGADRNTPFHIHASTLFNDGNWKWQDRPNKNKAKMESALSEMRDVGMICAERGAKISGIGNDGGRGYVDYKVEIWLSQLFVDHIIMSNTTSSKNRETLLSQAIPFFPEASRVAIEKMVSIGIPEEQAQSLLTEYGSHNIANSFIYTEIEQAKKLKLRRNFLFKNYFIKTLENAWHKDLDLSQVPDVAGVLQHTAEPPIKIPQGLSRQFIDMEHCMLFLNSITDPTLKDYATGRQLRLSVTDRQNLDKLIEGFNAQS